MARDARFNIEIGGRIRTARDDAGLTRDAVAEYVGVSPRFIADLECGRAGASVSTLRKLCEAIGVSANFILWGDGSTAKCASEEIASMLIGVDEELLPMVVESVRSQVQLVKAAQKLQR